MLRQGTSSPPGEDGLSVLSRKVLCFSTSVARPFAKLVRPPVQVYGIKGGCASALYSAASKQNKLEQVEKELLRVAQILKEPKMAALMLNPFAKRSVKEKSPSGMTTKFSPSRPPDPFAENGHLTNTPDVISTFSALMSVHHGEVPCTVTTAFPLDEAILSQLKTKQNNNKNPVLNSFLSKSQIIEIES